MNDPVAQVRRDLASRIAIHTRYGRHELVNEYRRLLDSYNSPGEKERDHRAIQSMRIDGYAWVVEWDAEGLPRVIERIPERDNFDAYHTDPADALLPTPTPQEKEDEG